MESNNLTEGIQSLLLVLSLPIVSLAILVLVNNTNPNPNSEIKAPVAEDVTVLCKFGSETAIRFRGTVVWREGKSLHVKHPKSSFVLQDPDHRCSVQK